MILPQFVNLRKTLRTFYAIKRKLFFQLIICVSFIILFGYLGLYYFEFKENEHFQTHFDMFYFLVTTLSTVGFGDKFVVTYAGKVIITLIIISSIFVIASVSALSAAVFVESHLKEELGMKTFSFKNHFIILGWNLKGPEIVDILVEKSQDLNLQIILIADLERKPVETPFLFFIKSNYPLTLESMKKGNVSEAKEIIILGDYKAGHNSDALIASHALLARSENKNGKIQAELLAPKNKALLEAAGVDRVIGVGELGGKLLAGSSLNDKKIVTILDELS